MTRKAVAERNDKRKRICLRFQKKRAVIKNGLNKAFNEGNIEETLALYSKLQSLPRDSSKHRQVNRCSCCNRSNGVYKVFGLCRCCLRVMFSNGLIPGLKKSSW